jgi:hypothetical protein
MAGLLPTPTNVPEAVSTGYQRQNTNFNAVTVGHSNIEIGNINNSNTPTIVGGSVIEVNGGIYRASSTETITNASNAGLSPPASNAQNYIYAVPGESSLSWQYSSSAPTWNAAKGGWYNGNNRAVVKLFLSGTQYNGKVILDSYNAMQQVNTEQTIPTTGGVAITIPGYVANKKKTYRFNLPPGAYRYTLTSGAGAGDANEKTGGIASTRASVNGTFIWHGGPITIKTGGDGFKGGDGGKGKSLSWGSDFEYGKGGGSGAGEATEILGVDKTDQVKAGRSGSGQTEGIGGYGGRGGLGGYYQNHSDEGSPITYGRDGAPGKDGINGGYGYGGGGDGTNGRGGSDNSYSSDGIDGSGGGNGGHSGGYNGINGLDSHDGAQGAEGGSGGAPGWERDEGDAGGSVELARVA